MQSIIYLFSRAVVFHKRPFLLEEHEQICMAIRNRKVEEAGRLMEKHLEADLEFISSNRMGLIHFSSMPRRR
ncbi:FCD domain-containing protein [Sporosarcina sp. Te-1]|uniref:FCD domain-containing protein n=1 Tax=Sporosarcina sp. Te-1 TaxID=2818390 RepID=UPI001FB0E30C|nr:FCD domain-containing protein [Sporosarcina sp. Te-1]